MLKKFKILKLKFIRYRRVRLPKRIRRFKLMSRHPFAVPVITILLLISLSGGIYLVARSTKNLPLPHDAKIVIISHDRQQQTVPSKEATVGILLAKLHLRLNQGDVVEPSLTAVIDQDQFRINIYRAVPVQIVDGTHKTFTFSASKTPRAIAVAAGATLYPEDRLNTDPVNNFVNSGAVGKQVIIDRAMPISIDLYGTPVVTRTQAATVAELIKEKHIKLSANDQIVPAPNTPISVNQHVAFIRTGTKVETLTQDIATPVQTINDATLAYGTSAIRQQGSPGQEVVTYQVAITNNVETGRTVIQKVLTRAPVTQIKVVGTSLSGIKGDMALAGIGPGDYNYVDYIVSHESGWRPNAGSVSGPYGLCQAYPGSKMAGAGSDWVSNPVTQLRWCNGYASRYGGWAGSYNHWLSNHNW